MKPRIEQLTDKHFVGMKMRMSFANNKTGLLWQNFMSRRKEIKHLIHPDLYSIEVYGAGFFNPFRPTEEFEKWAAVEVSTVETIPEAMETITIPSGLYAVFLHTGAANLASQTYEYVLGTWIPNSVYDLDVRPHFAVMGDKYKNNDPESQEELWFPIVPQSTLGDI